MAKFKVTFDTDVEASVIIEADTKREAIEKVEADMDIEDLMENACDLCYTNYKRVTFVGELNG